MLCILSISDAFAKPVVTSITAPDITQADDGATSSLIQVTYEDPVAILATTIDKNDLIIDNGASISGASSAPAGDVSPLYGAYTIIPPGGTWDAWDNGTYTISLAADQVSDTSGVFADAVVNLATFTVTIHPTVELSVSANAGTEAGGTAITVTATTYAPVAGDQTVDLNISGAGITGTDYTIPNTFLTIPDGAQTGSVTFTVQDDFLVEGAETATLTLANPSAGIVLGAVISQDIAIADDDLPGFTLSKITAAVNESGTTDTFTVVLTAQPASDVVFTVTGSDAGEATVAPATLTFAPANWNNPQIVTITGVDDLLIDGPQNSTVTVSVNDAASDDNFDPLADQTVTVTTGDDDASGFTLSKTTAAVNESGATDTFTVVLTAQPASDVVFTVTGSDASEATVAPATLTFTSGNWSNPQPVTITGVDDLLIDGAQTSTVTVSVNDGASDDNFDPLPDQTVTVTTADDDASGFTLSKTTAAVNESGTTDTFTVVLTAQPASDVVFTVSGSDASEATVAPATLTFTSGNWSNPQPVTITGADDLLIDGAQTSTVTVSVNDAASDDNFDPLPDQTVTVTTADDDASGFTLSKTTAAVNESGTTDTFTVVLTAQPASDVVFTVSGSDASEATVAPATLTFTSGNWSNPQPVTITGADDLLIDGAQTSTVTVSVNDAASDDNFDPLPDQTVTVTTADDDASGFTLSKTTAAVNESGATDTFTVVLTAQPASDVVFTVTGSDAGEATVAPATLTFTSGNWSNPQPVTITGVDDLLIDGAQTSTVTVSINDGASDDNFDPLPDQTVTVTTGDDDASGFTLSKTTAAVNESGTSDTFTVVLTAQPASDVVFTVTGSDAGEAAVAPATLTFTSGNWSNPQPVTITGVDDLLIDGPQNSTVTVSVNDAASDDNFDPLADQTVTVTTADDDASGFTLSKTTAAVNESGVTDTFTVVLTAQPASDVVFTVTGSDASEATVAPATLTFTSGNWSNPQPVTITGADDLLIDGAQTSTVTVSVNDATSDDNFDPLADQTVTVTTADDDASGFTLSKTTAAVNESGVTDTFTVVLTAQPASDVVFTVTGSDAGEAAVAPATLTFTSGNWSNPQPVTITGADDLLIDGAQTSTVTVSVNDATSDDNFDPLADQTVTVTTGDDDASGFTLSKTTAAVNESGTNDTFTVILTAQPASDVVFTVTGSDAGEAAVAPATLTFTSGNWSNPQPVTITGVDDLLIDGAQTSTVTVSVNDGASDDNFDPLPDQTVTVTTADDDASGFTLSKTTAAVNESGATDTFTVVLTAQPASDVVFTVTGSDVSEATVAPATLTFTPANWNNPQTVTITGMDDLLIDGPQNSTVIVSINDGASDDNFDPLPDQTVTVTTGDDDASGFTLSKTTAAVNESGSTDTFTIVLDAQPKSAVIFDVTSGNTSEATVFPGTLTFNSANWNTPQTVTITGADDSLIDGAQNSTVTVSVNASASDDDFDALPDQAVFVTTADDDAAGFSLSKNNALVAESGTTDTFTVRLDAQPASNVVIDIANADADEVLVMPLSLTFTSADWSLPQTVTITGVDDPGADGDKVTRLTLSVNDALSDDPFEKLAVQTVNVTTSDDDIPGFTVSSVSGNTAESSATATFTVRLNTPPTAAVTLPLVSTDASEGTVAPAALSFDAANWNIDRTVTITSQDDDVDDGDIVYTVALGPATSGDAAYNGIDPADVTVINVDDDVAGVAITQSGGSTAVDENGPTADTYTLVLTSQPTADVTVAVDPDGQLDIGAGPGNSRTVVFTSPDWNTPRTITVTGVNDAANEGDHTGVITHTAVSGDAHYNSIGIGTVFVAIADNDGLPVITTFAATGITYRTATLAGNVVDSGGSPVTERGIFFGQSPDPEITGQKRIVGDGDGVFATTYGGLAEETTYYARAYAVNAQGTAYGNVIQFTTVRRMDVPFVITDGVTDVTSTGVTGLGTVGYPEEDCECEIIDRGVTWSKWPYPDFIEAGNIGEFRSEGSATGSFSSRVNGVLEPNTTYYLRAYVSYSRGQAWFTDFGRNASFTTPPEDAVGLEHAIMILKMLTGVDIQGQRLPEASDINGDGAYGLDDAVGILRRLGR